MDPSEDVEESEATGASSDDVTPTNNAPEDVTPPESADRHSIPCPYNSEHLVSLDDFNSHIWKCRSERMTFYPHSLKLKRCQYNLRHFLPEEEIPFHELFCRTQNADLRSQLSTEPIHLDVADYLATQKIQAKLDKNDSDSEDSRNYDDVSDSDSDKTPCSVTSDIELSDVEEEDDTEVTMKRLDYLELKEQQII